jgi:hypothetical protein
MVVNHDHKFQNIYVHGWEADHFSVTSTGYSYEIEIKVSRSDFKADFKKPKHLFFKNIRNGFSILQAGLSYKYFNWNEIDFSQFPELRNFKIEYNNIRAIQVDYKSSPNRFYFACPCGLIESAEIPKYAGLVYVMDSGEARIIKKAPLIHNHIRIPES